MHNIYGELSIMYGVYAYCCADDRSCFQHFYFPKSLHGPDRHFCVVASFVRGRRCGLVDSFEKKDKKRHKARHTVSGRILN